MLKVCNIRRVARLATVIVALIAVVVSRSAVAAPVHVEVDTGRSQEFGAGISVGKDSECYVVTPLHVVEFARTITVTDRNGRSAKATRYQAPDGVDAALLKVEDGHTLDCPEDWDDGSSAESMLHDVDFLVSRKVLQRGMKQKRFFLSDESSSDIGLSPYGQMTVDGLAEGDSGSSLYAKNALAGMIFEVDTATGMGRAIKQSQIHALFGGIVLAQDIERALVNPVYHRYQENRYATVAILDFFDSRTPFDVVQLSAAAAAENLTSTRRGGTPQYPDDVDYIVSTLIVNERSRRESNSNYKAGAENESNLGKQLLNSLSNRTARYIYVSNIDVEVQISIPDQNRDYRHIERLEYRAALTNNTDQQGLRDEFITKAAVDGVSAAMQKYGLPVSPDPDEVPADQTFLGKILKFGEKKE